MNYVWPITTKAQRAAKCDSCFAEENEMAADRNGIAGENSTEFETEKESFSEQHPYYGTSKDVVDRYTHCVLCGANLHFSHVTDFSKNLTQETARCPECGVKVRQIMHRLQ